MRNLDHVAAFVAIADTGSCSAAARRLGLTSSAVNVALQKIEAELGLQLCIRGPGARTMNLTEAGLAYLEGCRKVLAVVGEVADALAGHLSGPSGLLRVSMPLTLGRLHLVPALGGFLDRHPDIRVEALLTDGLGGVAEEGVDAAFRLAPHADPRMAYRTLAEPVFRISASPAYLARRGTPRDRADLEGSGHQCINVVSPTIAGGLYPWRFLTADGRPEEREVRGRLAVTDSGAGLAAAIAGLGLAQLPDYVAGRALAAGELVEVLPEHRHNGPPISIGCLPARHHIPKIKAFIDYFVERFASGMAAWG